MLSDAEPTLPPCEAKFANAFVKSITFLLTFGAVDNVVIKSLNPTPNADKLLAVTPARFPALANVAIACEKEIVLSETLGANAISDINLLNEFPKPVKLAETTDIFCPLSDKLDIAFVIEIID